jgi:hypothetical protein
MGFVLVQNRALINQGGTTATGYADTWATNPTLGNKVTYEVIVNSYPGTAGIVNVTATDNAVVPNTYNVDVVASNSGSLETITHLSADISSLPASGQLVVTLSYQRSGTGISCYSMLVPQEVSGLVAGGADQTATLSSNAVSGTTITVGPTGTLSQASEFVLSSFSCDTGTTSTGLSIPSGWTLLGSLNQDDSNYIAFGAAYETVASTAAVSAAWGASTNVSGTWDTGAISTYKIAAAAVVAVGKPANIKGPLFARMPWKVAGDTTGPVAAALSATISEAGAAADTPSETMAAAVSIAEAGGAADSPSETSAESVSIAEAGSAADSPSASLAAASSISESGSAIDTESASTGGNFTASVSESGSAVDTESAGVLASISEAGSAADTESAGLAASSTVAESGSAADTPSASLSAAATITESGAAADTESSLAAMAAAIAEAGAALDTAFEALTASGTVSEAGSALDTESASSADSATVAESGSAADTSNGSRPGSAVYPYPYQVLSGVVYGPTGVDYTGTLQAGIFTICE